MRPPSPRRINSIIKNIEKKRDIEIGIKQKNEEELSFEGSLVVFEDLLFDLNNVSYISWRDKDKYMHIIIDGLSKELTISKKTFDKIKEKYILLKIGNIY